MIDIFRSKDIDLSKSYEIYFVIFRNSQRFGFKNNSTLNGILYICIINSFYL